MFSLFVYRCWKALAYALLVSPLPTIRNPFRPRLPFAVGIIIAASVLVAAGLALYESPQVRQWVDQSRRKIAIALHSLGDDIQPRRPSECSDDYEARKAETIRRKRNELIRRARAEGIAVDLDELAQVGRDDVEPTPRRGRPRTNASQKSFDDMVSNDGMLKKEDGCAGKATGADMSEKSVRRRGMAGFAAGAAFADPFMLADDGDDEPPQTPTTLHTEAHSPSTIAADTPRSHTMEADVPSSPPSGQLIDLAPTTPTTPASPTSPFFHPENPQTASILGSETDGTEHATQSFYSFTSSTPDLPQDQDWEADNMSAGTLTPRSDRSNTFSELSHIANPDPELLALSEQNDDDNDARSEAFSETGFTEGGFSDVGSQRGVLTPSSWTEVGSDDESEWGGPGMGGQVNQ